MNSTIYIDIIHGVISPWLTTGYDHSTVAANELGIE